MMEKSICISLKIEKVFSGRTETEKVYLKKNTPFPVGNGVKKPEESLPLVMLADGEAPSPDFGDPADNDEAFRIDLPGYPLDLGHFVVGYHTENHFCRTAQITAFAVEDGNTPRAVSL